MASGPGRAVTVSGADGKARPRAGAAAVRGGSGPVLSGPLFVRRLKVKTVPGLASAQFDS